MSQFVARISQSQKTALDEQVARMIFATNSPFQLVEHPEFQKLMLMLRPDYCGPTRKDVADTPLPMVFNKEKSKTKDAQKGEIVNIELMVGQTFTRNLPFVLQLQLKLVISI